MKKVLGVLVLLVVFFGATTVTASADDDFTRVSDGGAVGSNVENSQAYEVYEERVVARDSRVMLMFTGIVFAALVIGGGTMLVNHSNNCKMRNAEEREVNLRERQLALEERKFASGVTNDTPKARTSAPHRENAPVSVPATNYSPARDMMAAQQLQDMNEFNHAELNVPPFGQY